MPYFYKANDYKKRKRKKKRRERERESICQIKCTKKHFTDYILLTEKKVLNLVKSQVIALSVALVTF